MVNLICHQRLIHADVRFDDFPVFFTRIQYGNLGPSFGTGDRFESSSVILTSDTFVLPIGRCSICVDFISLS